MLPSNNQPHCLPPTHCLAQVVDLRANLERKGQRLYVALGRPETVIPDLVGSGSPPTTVFGSAEPCSDEKKEAAALAAALKPLGVPVELVWQRTMFLPDDLPAGLGSDGMPDKFTPWKMKLEKSSAAVRPPWSPPPTLPSPFAPAGSAATSDAAAGFSYVPTLADLGFPDGQPSDDGGAMADDAAGRFRGGETAALKRLQDWMFEQDKLKTYFEIRNGMLGQGYSTKFSPWLATGCLSPRHVYAECQRYEAERVKNKSTYWLVFEYGPPWAWFAAPFPWALPFHRLAIHAPAKAVCPS